MPVHKQCSQRLVSCPFLNQALQAMNSGQFDLTLIFTSLSTTLQAFSTLCTSDNISLNKQKSHGKTSHIK